jgi:hypothetical protein
MSQEEGAAEYQQAITDLNEAFKTGMRAFAKWCAENWKLDERDLAESREPLSVEYMKGWNAGMEGVDAALDSFLEEYHP